MARNKIFTPEVMAKIPDWLAQGLSAQEIAERIGCKLSSLSVRCSQYGISLRRRVRTAGGEAADPSVPLHPSSGAQLARLSSEPQLMRLRRLQGMFSGQPRPVVAIAMASQAPAEARNPEPQVHMELWLPAAVLAQLRKEAARKGITEARIAALLLETIARDDLYEAVLGSK